MCVIYKREERVTANMVEEEATAVNAAVATETVDEDEED